MKLRAVSIISRSPRMRSQIYVVVEALTITDDEYVLEMVLVWGDGIEIKTGF